MVSQIISKIYYVLQMSLSVIHCSKNLGCHCEADFQAEAPPLLRRGFTPLKLQRGSQRRFSNLCYSLVVCLIVSLLFSLDCKKLLAESAFGKDSVVRISVFQNLNEFKLSIKGEYEILDLPSGKVLGEGKALRESRVKVAEKGIQVGDEIFESDKISIAPVYDATLYANRRKFRGAIQVINVKDKGLLVVNKVDLEDYVKGVLFHEVSHRWPLEALKAQAVATRTYALYRMQTTKDKDFDVTNDIYSQVYGGQGSERYRTNLAVEATRNEILTFKGKIFPAFFHATCAGHTEDVGQVWKDDLAPLKGVRCPYCLNSPHYRWVKNFRSKTVQEKLNANGHHLGLIKDIAIISRNLSGRIKELRISTRDGVSVMISGKDFRNIVGPNEIRSNDYEISMSGYYFNLYGHGWGHGVGLCQWGAFGMAQKRFKFDEILSFYYPGTKVELYDNLLSESDQKILLK